MPIIDPALRSSVERQKIDESKFRNAYADIIIGIIVAFIIWMGYALFASRLDTRPDTTIEINPELNENGSGRTPSIPNTI